MRRIGQADVVFNATPNTNIVIQVKNTNRDGHIPFGATFGFSNAVEIPMPLDHRTTDLKTSIEWSNNKGMANFGWDGSSFDNNIESVVWDNPLRFGPDAVGAPSQGRHDLVAGQYADVSPRHRRRQHPVERPPDRIRGVRTGPQQHGPAAPHHQHGVRAAAAAGAHHR